MIIYKITNKENGKMYVGLTTYPMKKRWVQHISKSKNPKYYFHNAIGKHGVENFEISILEKCSSIEELKQKEPIWIAIYDSSNPKIGYNSTKGGEGVIPNEATRKKLSNAQKDRYLKKPHPMIGKHHSPQTIAKMSAVKKGEKNPNYRKSPSSETRAKMSVTLSGKKRSPETCKKMSESKKGEKHHMYGKHHSEKFLAKISKPVLQYDKQNNFIKEWSSMSEVERELKIDTGHISKVCRHKHKSAGGFIWEYKILEINDSNTTF